MKFLFSLQRDFVPKSMTELNCKYSHVPCSACFFRAPRFMAVGVAVDTALSLLPHGDPGRLLVSCTTGRALIQDNGFNIALNGEVKIQVSIMGQNTGQYQRSQYRSVSWVRIQASIMGQNTDQYHRSE